MKTIYHDEQEHSVLEVDYEKQQVKGLLRTFLALRHRNFRLSGFANLSR